MKDDDIGMLLGVGLLLALALKERTMSSIDWGSANVWMWPVPDMLSVTPMSPTQPLLPGSRTVRFAATISNDFDAAKHRGVDILYRGKLPAGADKLQWFAPDTTPIVAARAGTVYQVNQTPRGWQMVIDHGKPWATYYQHMSSVEPGMVKGKAVRAGERIGTMGSDPTDAEHVRHLHFETWYKGAEEGAVDPAAAMQKGWLRTTWMWTGK